MISVSKIESISDHTLALLSATDTLRADILTKDAHKHSENILGSLRKLYIASILKEKTIVCVAGLQGVGKTSLMRSFFDIDEKYLNITQERGERLPVLITEDEVPAPLMKVTMVGRDSNSKLERQTLSVDDAEQFVSMTRGGDEKIMYLELVLPYKRIGCKEISFMLLPGYEKKSDYWDDLIDFSINSSDAAVYVFRPSSISDGDNVDFIKNVEERFNKNIVYVISRSDDSKDDNTEVRQTCIEVLNLKGQEDRVVCAGIYADQEKNNAWISSLQESLNKYLLNGDELHNNRNDKYIIRELQTMKENLYTIRQIIKDDGGTDLNVLKNDTLLRAFDRAIEDKRKALADSIDEQFKMAENESITTLETLFSSSTTKWDSIKRTIFGSDVKDQYVRTREMVKKSLISSDGKSIPDKYLFSAVMNTVQLMDGTSSDSNNMTTGLPNGDVVPVSIPKNTVSADCAADLCTLLKISEDNSTKVTLKNENQRQTLKVLAEILTYYFGLQNCNKLAESRNVAFYEPKQMEALGDTIINGGKSTKQFAAGLAGVMGVDLIGDGSLNLVVQVAESIGISLVAATIASVSIVGIGAGIAVFRDLNRLQREDYQSACLAISDTYEAYKKRLLSNFDKAVSIIRERIESNLIYLTGDQAKIKAEYNALVEVDNILHIITDLITAHSTSAYGPVLFASKEG